jgi:hypothetical protein
MVTHKTGGEVDAFCTKCQLTLAHTILAMVGTKIARVRCNTCGGDHAMRGQPGSSSRSTTPRTGAARPRATKEEKVIISFEQRLGEKDAASARSYSPKERYALDEVIRHPTFGLGIVTAVRVDKIDIDFKAAQKTLIHGRDGGASAQPTFARPTRHATGPADKPMSDPLEETPAEAPSAATEE